MSVRYIWEKCTYVERYYKDTYEIDQTLTIGSSSGSLNRLVCLPTEPTLNNVTGKFSFTGTGRVQITSYADPDTNDYPYAIFRTSSEFPSYDTSADVDLDDIVEYVGRRYTNTKWNFTIQSNKYILQCYYNTTSNTYPFYQYMSDASPIPDDLLGYVSSNRSSEYPSFDVSGEYFYYSCDNDVIDPDKVTIPSLILYNDTITIELTESEDAINNSYGTISYTYQYKVDSGPWTDIATTSETTQTLKIPSGTSKIQVRALAKDNIGFTSSTYIYSDEVSVYASAPPTAPSYISVNRVIAGWQSTVTWGESTDSDGTIQNYTLERNYSQTGWTDVQSSLSRSFSESIQSSWTTVQYRVKAVDNSGTPSPYTTSELYQIKSDILMISGPSLKNFGIKMGTFGFSVEVYIAGTPSSNTVNVEIKVDDSVNYSQTIAAGTEALTEIDTTTLSEGDHTITVTATKGGYDTAVETYTFRIQSITLPSGGNVLQFQDSEGKPIMPVTIAKAVLLSDGTDLETKINSIESQMS